MEQSSGTMLTAPQIYDCPYGVSVRAIGSNLKSLKPLPHMARNDYRACLHATWSDPEGSSHSGNIVCRGVAGGVASILKPAIVPGLNQNPTLFSKSPCRRSKERTMCFRARVKPSLHRLQAVKRAHRMQFRPCSASISPLRFSDATVINELSGSCT